MMKRAREEEESGVSEPDDGELDSKFVALEMDEPKPVDIPKTVLNSPSYQTQTYCRACRKRFPTEHFLDLHFSEHHDPFVEVRKHRGEKTYACFVEGCNKLCRDPGKRRLHLLDKHNFPRHYDFWIVSTGLGKINSMLRSIPQIGYQRTQHGLSSGRKVLGGELGGSSNADNENGDLEEDPTASETGSDLSSAGVKISVNLQDEASAPTPGGQAGQGVEGLTKSMSALKFVPPSVRFGKARGGFARK